MNLKIRKDIYKKTFVIPNMSTNYNSKNIADIYSISKLSKDGIIKIDANYNYSYDKTNNLSHVYKFYNNGKKFKEVRLNHNVISNIVNDKYDIQGINSTKINILIYLVNNNKNNNPIDLFDYNTVQVIYNDNIDTLKSDINKSNISSNLGMINTNKSNISSNLEIINTNKSNISSNLGKINDNENSISNNLSKINDNENFISNNLSKINDNENSVSNNLEKIDNFTQYILKSSKDFEQTYTIEKRIFRFNKDKNFYTIFEKEIEYDFIKNSLLFVKNDMYYKYDNLANDYHRLQHEYNIYDSENSLIHKYLFNKDTYYNENLDPILHTSEDFCIYFKKDYKKIKLNLQLHRHNRHIVGNIDLEVDDDNENYINIDYLDENNENKEKIDTNKNDISTNLINMNTNEDNIAFNLKEINYIKNNISK